MPNDFDNAIISAKNSIFPGVFGAQALGMRPTTLQIITRTYLGPHAGANVPTLPDSILTLPPYTKIRHVSQREIAGSGGAYEDGDISVTEIMPSFTNPATGQTGGFTEAQLHPLGAMGNSQTDQAVEIIYRCTPVDPNRSGISGDYALIEIQRDKSRNFKLVIGRKRTTP